MPLCHRVAPRCAPFVESIPNANSRRPKPWSHDRTARTAPWRARQSASITTSAQHWNRRRTGAPCWSAVARANPSHQTPAGRVRPRTVLSVRSLPYVRICPHAEQSRRPQRTIDASLAGGPAQKKMNPRTTIATSGRKASAKRIRCERSHRCAVPGLARRSSAQRSASARFPPPPPIPILMPNQHAPHGGATQEPVGVWPSIGKPLSPEIIVDASASASRARTTCV